MPASTSSSYVGRESSCSPREFRRNDICSFSWASTTRDATPLWPLMMPASTSSSSLDVARRHAPLALDNARCNQLFVSRAGIELLAQRVPAKRFLQLLLGVHDARRHSPLALGDTRLNQLLVGRASTQLVIERVAAKRHLQLLGSLDHARCHAPLALDDARLDQLFIRRA
eukprot:scaffold84106_cov75-Phaeocystis_antarctica.AAC.2